MLYLTSLTRFFNVSESVLRTVYTVLYIHMNTLNRSFQEALNSDFSVKLLLVGLP